MPPLALFEAYGIEIEYMIVHADDLSVFPIGDRLLFAASNRFAGEVERGPVCWSNELVLHVVELKTNGPRPSLGGLAADLVHDTRAIDAILAPLGARLLPGSMHPFMDPLRESRLWPHEYGEVYRAYDRIFGCKGHGWSNLQSLQINLPFADDREFARLHAAIRLVLPLLPAIAASSPIVEGRVTGTLDNRLVAYRQNQRRIASVAGMLIPEQVDTESAYRTRILDVIASDLRHFDPDGVLEPEWVNSRGAIARFVRNSIEIRVLDSQECPAADLAVAAATVAVVRALVEERWSSFAEQRDFHESLLAPLFVDATECAGDAVATDARYLRCFGVDRSPVSLAELWAHLLASLDVEIDGGRAPLDVTLRHGCLAKRIVTALHGETSAGAIRDVYRELADCLVRNEPFVP